MKQTFLIALALLVLCSCHSAQTTQEQERQAKIEEALKGLKDENADARIMAILILGQLEPKEYVKDIAGFLKDENAEVRGYAVWALGQFGAKEYTKDIAKLLESKDPVARRNAVLALGKLGAKEYADEIGKLINDSSECFIWDEAKELLKQTTVSAEAERVLKEWGYDIEKLKAENKK